MNTKLYIGNLAATTTERALRDLCSPHGNVAEVNLPVDRETGQRRGFGIVIMATAQGAQAATLAIHGKEVDARVLTVAEHVPMKPAAPAAGQSVKSQARW